MKLSSRCITKQDQFLYSYVLGLLSYAKQDSNFSSRLSRAILNEDWDDRNMESYTLQRFANQSSTAPTTITEATTLWLWLKDELNLTNTPNARNTLTAWAIEHNNHERPFIVMGLGGTIVPGLTVGDPSIKRKKKNHLQIVFDATAYAKLSTVKMAQITTTLTQAILTNELKLAGGSIYRLHPDSAEWYLSEPHLKLYSDTTEIIGELQTILATEHVSHAVFTENERVCAIAISPAVQDALIEETGADALLTE